MKANRSKLIELVARFDFGREIPQNRGPFVRLCLAINGDNKEGSAWCAAFVSLVLYVHTRGTPPFRLSDGTKELLAAVVAAGRERAVPVAPGLCFVMKNGKSEHVTFIADVGDDTFATVGGNEGNPALPASNNGYGVFWRERTPGPQFRYFSLEDL